MQFLEELNICEKKKKQSKYFVSNFVIQMLLKCHPIPLYNIWLSLITRQIKLLSLLFPTHLTTATTTTHLKFQNQENAILCVGHLIIHYHRNMAWFGLSRERSPQSSDSFEIRPRLLRFTFLRFCWLRFLSGRSLEKVDLQDDPILAQAATLAWKHFSSSWAPIRLSSLCTCQSAVLTSP